jgi:FMN phosphatase YigB (HAD superfamily)
LRQQDYRLALISNASDDADVQTLVDKAGIRPFFEMILTSAAAGIRKPNPQIFQIVLEKLGVAADRAAMIGDTLGADILGAQNAGLFSIWITRRADAAGNRAHTGLVHPDVVIDTLAELPLLLSQLVRSPRSG